MNILLLTAYFPPDTGSAAHFFYELGTALVERGHQVTVTTGMPGYHAQGSLERYKGKKWIMEKVEGMEVVRAATPQLPRHLMVGRALWQFSGAVAFFLASLRLAPHTVAMVYSPPLPLGLTAWGLRRLKGTPFILNVQDLFPQSIIDLGLLKNSWLIRLFEAMERFVYRQADAITVHSEGNRQHVTEKCRKGEGGEGERRRGIGIKVEVIPNWVDTDFIRPGERMNGFRQEHGLADSFVISFAGVLGYSQDLDVVLEAARLVNHQPSSFARQPVTWLIMGDGVERTRLEEKVRSMRLCNVRFLPMQPREKYPELLSASDVCLVTLHEEVKTPVVPSKILSIMAAARPIVAAMDLEGDAPKLIAEAGCGICVPPGDARALAEAIMKLYLNRSLCQELGRNGRRYAEEHLSLETAVRKYEELFSNIIERRNSP
jgi:glycosyltransferase involved in cell wall biosynthesis